MKNILKHFSKKKQVFRNPYITKETMKKTKAKKKVTNKDVDLSDDLVFDRVLTGIKQLAGEEPLTETGCVHVGTGIIIKQKEFSETFCKGIQCDCCGDYVSPFSFNTLCDKCQERMDRDFTYSKVFETERKKQNTLDKVWFVKQKI